VDASREVPIAPGRPSPRGFVVGWVLALACALYAAYVYLGLGAPPGGMPRHWWDPDGSLLDWAIVRQFVDRPAGGILLLGTPPSLILLALYVRPTPALARALAASSIGTVAIMAYYGLAAMNIWNFFHWRASVVMLASGVALGCTLTAPDLARSWSRLRVWARIAVYLPVFFAIASLIRNATGTDETLFFNFSPWPAIPILGLEIGSYCWLGVLMGLAIGTISFAAAKHPAARIVGVVIGIAWPVMWFASRFGHQTEPSTLAVGGVISASLMVLAIRLPGAGERRQVLEQRALYLGLGAALVALPLLSGRALADGDYVVSKHIRARQVINALAAYYDDEETYPDELEELIDGDYIGALPKPRVGFRVYAALGLLKDHAFHYQSLGSSYVLEFVSTEWVMCSYNPPWDDYESWDDDEDEEEEEEAQSTDGGDAACLNECVEVCLDDCDEDDGACTRECESDCADRCIVGAPVQEDDGSDEDERGESWSCPDTRPELW
jgi:hypothetical protein